jgi:hypothetical protein
MPAFNSKVQICNLANGSLGLKNSINNIDTPRSDKEIVYAQWYDITRQYMLKFLMPNFALARKNIAALTAVPDAYSDFYTSAYPVPSDCLKVLGLGPVDTDDTKPTIEGNTIFTNVFYPDAPSLRYIADITDVTQFSPDFIMAFAAVLGKLTAMVNTQDPAKKQSMLKDAVMEWQQSTAQNAQENKPIRYSRSRFREARRTTFVTSGGKR